MSTVGVFSTAGDIMSTLGGYHEYTGGFWYKREKATTKFEGFVLAPFSTMQV